MSITDQLNDCRQYFETGVTKPYAFRKEQLKKLKAAIEKYESEIYTALYTDLKKSKEESWVTENGLSLSELNFQLKHLREWMEPVSKTTNLLNFPSSSYIYKEPLGVVLIIAPWNYPFQLLMNPVIGAIAAGNSVVVKPSEHAPATAGILKKIFTETFDSRYILFTEGDGAALVPEMMNNFTFDHVFFTGSTTVGKSIYKMAAEKLVPVTLELGGKSPCVVESDADIKVAAKRIAMTKFSNAGQMCVAPDYILVHATQQEKLISEIKNALQQFFGSNAAASENYGKIINERQFERLVNLLNESQIEFGGKHDKTSCFIEPTIITNVNSSSAIMQDEIFGPLLPVIPFTEQEEALKIIAEHKNPLAFYVFTSSSKKENDWINKVAFGGGCVNNASWHLTNHRLPFGGRGNSGIGMYHGKYSFDTFSHTKSVLKTPTWLDPSIKYPPFTGKLKLFKWFTK